MAAVALHLLLLIFLITVVQAQVLNLISSDDYLISDGLHHVEKQEPMPNTCDHQYGFLPCADNSAGYIFQILVYQGLLIYGEHQLSSGSRVLLNVLGVKKFGGVIFRILNALPSMMLLIVSGVISSKENAQSQVSLVVGIYAGMTVFSLTLQWGICVIFGQTDLTGHIEASNTHRLSVKEKLVILKDTGVSINQQTRDIAGIMLLSLIPYTVVQLVHISNTSSENRVLTMITLVVSSLSLIAYFIYQILNNERFQKISSEYSTYEVLRTGFLQHVQRRGPLVNEKGDLNADVIESLFKEFDINKDGIISKSELLSRLTQIVFREEVIGKRALMKSLFQVSLGIIMLTFLGGPLMVSILQLSYAMGFPSFGISFVIVPLAMNTRALIAAIDPASQKSQRTASLTFSELYSGVIMNNITGLTALLAIVYAKELTWDFSAEVLTILVVCAIIGILAYSCNTYPLWTCILAFFLYPFSLGLFYLARFFFKWN